MPARGIQHVDLAVEDVERSVAFYSEVLGPLGLKEKYRLPTYRGTEDVIYLEYGVQGFGLRRADGGEYRYYNVGIELNLRDRVQAVVLAYQTGLFATDSQRPASGADSPTA